MSEEKKETAPITVTAKAAEKAKEVLANEKANYLRIYVLGGGCSGFQYGLKTEDDKTEADQLFETNGVKVIVDPISIRYLQGVEIDFTDNLMGGGFFIKNPNAKGTCGCGQSFTTED